MQECSILWYSGKREIKTPLKFLLVDFLRNRKNRYIGCLLRDSGEYEFSDDQILKELSLSERQRTMIVLKYKWGFNQDEIAECLGINRSRVSQEFTVLMEQLKKEIV